MGIDWLKSKKERAQDAERARIRKEAQDESIERRKADIDASAHARRKADAEAKREAELTPEQLERERFKALPLDEQKAILRARSAAGTLSATVTSVQPNGSVDVKFEVSTAIANPTDSGTFSTARVYDETGKRVDTSSVEIGMTGLLSVDNQAWAIPTRSRKYENVIITNPMDAWILVLTVGARPKEDADK